MAGLGACSPSGKKTGADSTIDTLRTAETVNLLNNLRKVPTQGIMFGHHDDPLYGVGWEAVSYTHLDVYKRQVSLLLKQVLREHTSAMDRYSTWPVIRVGRV